MFGYHNSNRCGFDLWSPVTANSHSRNADPIQKGYGLWEDTPYHTAIENRAFSSYCVHITTLDDIVNKIFEAAQNGVMNFDCTCFETLTTSDIEYIECCLNKLGVAASLTLD